jgi:hypothetical protein
MTDDPLTACPVCDGPVKRLIGAGAGIIFKGSGFYCTDYKNSGGAATASDNTNSGDAGEKGATETKKSGDHAESKPKAVAETAS